MAGPVRWIFNNEANLYQNCFDECFQKDLESFKQVWKLVVEIEQKRCMYGGTENNRVVSS